MHCCWDAPNESCCVFGSTLVITNPPCRELPYPVTKVQQFGGSRERTRGESGTGEIAHEEPSRARQCQINVIEAAARPQALAPTNSCHVDLSSVEAPHAVRAAAFLKI